MRWLIVLLFPVIISCGLSKDSDPTFLQKKLTAYLISQEHIKSYLVSPSTAKFPTQADKTLALGDNSFCVYGHVDAQNHFGAMIRSHFMVNLSYGGGDVHKFASWGCNKININGRTVHELKPKEKQSYPEVRAKRVKAK